MRSSFLSTGFAHLTPVSDDGEAVHGAPTSIEQLARIDMTPQGVASRKLRVVTTAAKGPLGALNHYDDDVEMSRVLLNRTLLFMADKVPYMGAKRALLRKAGIAVGTDVSIDMRVLFDPVYPELIEIEDGAIIGMNAIIAAHQYGVHSYEIGRVRVGKQAMVGAMAVVVPGVVIGEGAALGPGSVATRDIPAHEFWAGVPARKISDHRAPKG